jgi:hypothetical protein
LSLKQLERGHFIIVSSYYTVYHKYLRLNSDSLDEKSV